MPEYREHADIFRACQKSRSRDVSRRRIALLTLEKPPTPLSLLFPYVIDSRSIRPMVHFRGAVFADERSSKRERNIDTRRLRRRAHKVDPRRGSSQVQLINSQFIYHARWRRAIMIACAAAVSILLMRSIESESETRNENEERFFGYTGYL